MAQLGELGLMGVAIGEKDGGTGLDYLVRAGELTIAAHLIRDSAVALEH